MAKEKPASTGYFNKKMLSVLKKGEETPKKESKSTNSGKNTNKK